MTPDFEPTVTQWTAAEIRSVDDTRELQIATTRANGSTSPWTPIWVVVVADEVFVRTWTPRTTGWYGRAVARRRAVISLFESPVDVVVTAVGDTNVAAVDAAYRAKYGVAAAASMVTPAAQTSTLKLARASSPAASA